MVGDRLIPLCLVELLFVEQRNNLLVLNPLVDLCKRPATPLSVPRVVTGLKDYAKFVTFASIGLTCLQRNRFVITQKVCNFIKVFEARRFIKVSCLLPRLGVEVVFDGTRSEWHIFGRAFRLILTLKEQPEASIAEITGVRPWLAGGVQGEGHIKSFLPRVSKVAIIEFLLHTTLHASLLLLYEQLELVDCVGKDD